MANPTIRIQVFISSPGDLTQERSAALEVISQVNQDIGALESFFLEPIMWETHTYSARGEYAQEVISSQVGTDYDIFLGMMATRFGSPTRNFNSGTEEEFQLALEKNKRTGLPAIAFLFSETLRSPATIDPKQFQLVADFRKVIAEEGVLYRTFQDETQFRLIAWRTLVGSAREVLKKINLQDPERRVIAEVMNFDPLSSYNDLVKSDSEVNSFLLGEIAAEQMSLVGRTMESLTKSIKILSKTLIQEASNLKNPRHMIRQESLIRTTTQILKSMKSTSRDFIGYIPKLHDSLQESLTAVQRCFGIMSSRREVTAEVVQNTLEPLLGLRGAYETLAESVRSTRTAIGLIEFPPSPLNVERRRLVALLDDTALVLDRGIETMNDLEHSLKDYV